MNNVHLKLTPKVVQLCEVNLIIIKVYKRPVSGGTHIITLIFARNKLSRKQ